jgi:DNA-binding transcriptional ArsR family regulator
MSKWQHYPRHEMREAILRELRDEDGLSITTISKILKMDRGVVSEEVKKLVAEGKARVRQEGPVKLIYYKKRRYTNVKRTKKEKGIEANR